MFTPTVETAVRTLLDEQPDPLCFVTVSGAHLYGFASPDSDVDLRGAHCLPLVRLVGLDEPDGTITHTEIRDGVELDLVTHDIRKFLHLLLKNNGYVLEQLYSPLVVRGSEAFDELRALGRGCITRHHVHHYLGFAQNQWALFLKSEPRRIKPLLYVFRVLFTGIHLMRSGEVEANLVRLNETFRCDWLDALIQQKQNTAEKAQITDDSAMACYQEAFHHWSEVLKRAGEDTALPDRPSARAVLNDWLVRVRQG